MNTIVHNRKLSFGRMLLIGIAAGLPFVTQAGEPTREYRISSSIVVSYADLDLSEPAGAHTLYARLKMAARKVCGHRPPPMELHASMAYRDCYDSALNKAVRRVDSQQLYALHAMRGRQTTVS
jgi:UrcA family protein